MLSSDQREVIHDKVAADIAVLVADGKNRQRAAAIGYREIHIEPHCLSGRRLCRCPRSAVVEIDPERSDGANAGEYVCAQRVIARL